MTVRLDATSSPSPIDPMRGSSPTTRRIPTPRSLRSSRSSRPDGAPNVLIVLLDDVGFGASSAFGGPCQTPTAERLAAGGLRYNRFHTTALCAPTRQALLTGRNHHSVGMGSITETADVGTGAELAAAQHDGAAGHDPEAQRLLHRAVRQVPRGAGVADLTHGSVRRMAVREAAGSRRSTGSSAGRTTSGSRPSTAGPRRSSRRPPRRRATTSRRISPTTR